jgi:perosamine synthetase
MKPIFSSLGSNYNFSLALRAFGRLFLPSGGAKNNLKKELEKKFGGEVHLLYKGRDAIQCALNAFNIGRGDEVLTQALTCYAIEEAILRTGATPVFVDIEKDGLNLSMESLVTAHEKVQNPKAVIIQNTLGVPADIRKIREWCDKNKLILIEDLAQSIGAVSDEGKLLGSYGDAIVLSFGRDKVIDAVSGGAVVFRKGVNHKLKLSGMVGLGSVIKDMVYPILTWKIRKAHRVLLGKMILRLFKNVGLMTSAVSSPTKTAAPMPAPHAWLALLQLRKLDEGLKHRRKISEIYLNHLNSRVNILTNEQIVKRGTNLRIPFKMEDPNTLIKYLAQKNIYLADRWYRSPVDCGNLSVVSVYKQGSCPNAEKLSKEIINLPTHINVKTGDAMRIVNAVNDYLE